MSVSNSQLVPRNGHTLRAGLVARISGCANQKELSLEDQLDHDKEFLSEIFDGQVEFLVISTVGKGERLDRPELGQIVGELRKGYLDVLVFEDLGRLVRGVEAVRLLGIAVDHGTRVISPNDNVDTALDTWETDATKACADHVAHNAHTSRRIKHKSKNRFMKFGGAMACPIAGYLLPENCKTYDDWLKEPNADVWIVDGFMSLRDTLNCTAVADIFNARGIPTGPYCTRETWDGAMIRRFYANSLLKGMARRNVMHTVKIYETGQRKSVKNPNGPVYYSVPHLAYLDPIDFDELQEALKKSNARYKRPLVDGKDSRLGVSRKRTKFPGQHARCYYCGHHYVWGGNGITANLMCSNARCWQCWNTIGFNGADAAAEIQKIITSELYQLDGFDDQYRELVGRAGRTDHSDIAQKWQRLECDEGKLAKAEQNFADAIEKCGVDPIFEKKLEQLRAEKLRLRVERRKLERLGQENFVVPESLQALRDMFEQEFSGAAIDSPEFGNLLRKLCPDFFVYLVGMCDGGAFLPRAQVRIALDGIIPDAAHVSGLDELLRRDATFDLFTPPQRERIRMQAVDGRARGLGVKAIAAEIAAASTERPTTKVVNDALALHDHMQKLSLPTPYVFLNTPPEDAKLRRHKNAKYRFTPRAAYTPPALM